MEIIAKATTTAPAAAKRILSLGWSIVNIIGLHLDLPGAQMGARPARGLFWSANYLLLGASTEARGNGCRSRKSMTRSNVKTAFGTGARAFSPTSAKRFGFCSATLRPCVVIPDSAAASESGRPSAKWRNARWSFLRSL
jgi:hypothetical protein